MRIVRQLMAVVAVLIGFSASAGTFIIPDDDVLIARASAGIVSGTILDSHSELTPGGGVRTLTQLWIDRVLSGPYEVGQSIEIVEPGGTTPVRSVYLHGVPRFNAGDRVLVLLVKNSRGQLETLEYALGKFSYRMNDRGIEYLLRDEDNVCGWAPGFRPYRELARRSDGFLKHIEAIVSGRIEPQTYADEYSDACASGQQELVASPEAAVDYSFCGCRWCGFNAPTPVGCVSPPADVSFLTSGTQTGIADSLGAVDVATSVWTADGGSSIAYSRGAATGITDANNCVKGSDAIVFNDPNDQITGSYQASGGILGFGGPCFSGSHSFGGSTFAQIIQAGVVVQDGVSNANLISQGVFEAMLAHELGHTLGFRHSNESGAPNSTTNALMNSILNRSSAFLSEWDFAAASAMYGSGAPVCAASISQHPQSQSVPSGGSANLSVTVGTGTYSYQWYRGAKSNTSDPVSGATSSSMNTGTLTQTTSFWVRVTRTDCEPDSALDSNAATVTVIPCTASIAQHPQSQSVPEGSAANLSVSVGSGTYSFQWYRGQSGDESQLLSGKTSSTLTTDPINSTTSFWVKVTRTDCNPDISANSNTATVTTCEIPAIVDEPQDASVTSGSGTTLSVTATGTDVFYQWYRGNSGVTSSPVIGATNPTLATGNLTQTSKYWVRVANNCGGTKTVNSRTVTVTVTAQCTAPQIAVQPQPVTIATGGSTTLTVTATGTSLVYQWFEGATGVTTKPVGTNSPSYTTPALTATTSFWVQITNGCGQLASLAATVTVTAACTGPAIQQQPQSVTIAPAKTATLSVTATGTSLAYQWYEGLLGNTTKPVGTNSASFTTPELRKNASYWVRLTNSCGQLASQAATVTVKSSRRHPIRRQ